MCFCLVHFHIDLLLPGFCWLLERGVAKSLSFCWQKLQDCAHACMSPCPRLFCPHSWWVGGKRQRSLQRAWTWFLVARHITFLCSPKIFKKFCNYLNLRRMDLFRSSCSEMHRFLPCPFMCELLGTSISVSFWRALPVYSTFLSTEGS